MILLLTNGGQNEVGDKESTSKLTEMLVGGIAWQVSLGFFIWSWASSFWMGKHTRIFFGHLVIGGQISFAFQALNEKWYDSDPWDEEEGNLPGGKDEEQVEKVICQVDDEQGPYGGKDQGYKTF